MRRWATSAVVSNMLVIGVLISSALGVASLSFYQFVQKPRVDMIASVFATQIGGITAAVKAMNPAQREDFLRSLDTFSDGGLTLDDPADWEIESPQPTLVRLFLENLGRRLPHQQIAFTPAPLPQLWVEVPFADAPSRWLRMPLSRYLELPTGVVVAAVMWLFMLVLVGTLWLLWRFRRRLRRLSEAIDSMGVASMSPLGRSPLLAPVSDRLTADAIAELTAKFNDMTGRLERADQDRTLMLAGVSHDLRSILTRLRLGIALDASDGRSAALIRHVDEMNRLIGQFLDYAKPPQESDVTMMDLNEVAGTVVAEFEAEGVAVLYTEGSLPLARLQPLAVRRLLTNLVDNALRHAGGEVEVRTVFAGGFVHLQVLDRGPGVSPSELSQLTQPFFRTPAARARVSGSGLGLAIAHRIVEAHGGFLCMALRTGGGLRVEAGFPAEAP